MEDATATVGDGDRPEHYCLSSASGKKSNGIRSSTDSFLTFLSIGAANLYAPLTAFNIVTAFHLLVLLMVLCAVLLVGLAAFWRPQPVSVLIAGLAVVTGFLYSYFVTAPDSIDSGGQVSGSLLAVSELQAVVVVAGLVAAIFSARSSPWRDTYWRLALGALVSLVTLTLSNVQAGQGEYHKAVVFDFTWILPFAFYPWAAALAPSSEVSADSLSTGPAEELTRPRGWVIFAAVALLPFVDFGLRRIAPGYFSGFRDISTAVTIISTGRRPMSVFCDADRPGLRDLRNRFYQFTRKPTFSP